MSQLHPGYLDEADAAELRLLSQERQIASEALKRLLNTPEVLAAQSRYDVLSRAMQRTTTAIWAANGLSEADQVREDGRIVYAPPVHEEPITPQPSDERLRCSFCKQGITKPPLRWADLPGQYDSQECLDAARNGVSATPPDDRDWTAEEAQIRDDLLHNLAEIAIERGERPPAEPFTPGHCAACAGMPGPSYSDGIAEITAKTALVKTALEQRGSCSVCGKRIYRDLALRVAGLAGYYCGPSCQTTAAVAAFGSGDAATVAVPTRCSWCGGQLDDHRKIWTYDAIPGAYCCETHMLSASERQAHLVAGTARP